MSKKNTFWKNELFLKVAYAGINVYLITLLGYVTYTQVFTLDNAKLSAFGSILSAAATLFATLVAVILFREWKKQAKYMDCVKIIYEIQNELNVLLSNIEKIQKFPEYSSSFQNLRFGLISSQNYDSEATGLISADDLREEIRIFSQKLIPIEGQTNKINEKLELLSVFLGVDLDDKKEYINQLVRSLLSDLMSAYKVIVLFNVGNGSVPGTEQLSEYDDIDLQFASNVLSVNGGTLKIHMKQDKIKKFQKYFKKLKGAEGEPEVLNFNDVVMDLKNEIQNILKQIRKEHIE